MTRLLAVAALFATVLIGGFFYGIVCTLNDEFDLDW